MTSRLMRGAVGAAVLCGVLGPAQVLAQATHPPPRTELWSEHYRVPDPAPQVPAPAADSAACPVGAAVDVLDGGKWYAARVLEGPDRMNTCKISYDGYDASSDEWVSRERIRPRAAAAAPAAQPAAPPPAAGTPPAGTLLPEGSYPCYAWNGSSLDYTYVDLRILRGGRYAVDEAGGTYSRSGDALRFTGHLANATGSFALKSGTPEITLVFDGDPFKSMSCARE